MFRMLFLLITNNKMLLIVIIFLLDTAYQMTDIDIRKWSGECFCGKVDNIAKGRDRYL